MRQPWKISSLSWLSSGETLRTSANIQVVGEELPPHHMAGVSWIDLKRHGRWASDSAPQRYIEETQKRANKVPTILVQTAMDNNNNNKKERPTESPPKMPSQKQSRTADRVDDRRAKSKEVTAAYNEVAAASQSAHFVQASTVWPASYYLPAFNQDTTSGHAVTGSQPTGVFSPFRQPTFVQKRSQPCRQTVTIREPKKARIESHSEQEQLSPGTLKRLFEEDFGE